MTVNIRHNGFGVDVIGTEENVHAAMGALNAHADLLAACERMARWFHDVHGALACDELLMAGCPNELRADMAFAHDAIEKARAS